MFCYVEHCEDTGDFSLVIESDGDPDMDCCERSSVPLKATNKAEAKKAARAIVNSMRPYCAEKITLSREISN